VTTTSADNVVSLLQHALPSDADGWFAVIGAGDVVAKKKPAPDIYDYVLERLHVPRAECIALEDSENGLRSARAAGLTTVVTITDYSRTHDFTGAALVLDHLGEPDLPCRALFGGALLDGSTYVDLEVLGRLLPSGP
jgi:beta-phosphoglucomutase-like phosphatase (HAD superfamily)